ncbi:MAG: hypothetical protein IJR50_03485, partial [Treponema sp.]|nr:hypothetical protein [Treponema sp.]
MDFHPFLLRSMHLHFYVMQQLLVYISMQEKKKRQVSPLWCRLVSSYSAGAELNSAQRFFLDSPYKVPGI